MFTRSKRSFLDTKPRFVAVECTDDDPECDCGNTFPKARQALGYTQCLKCSNEMPKVANLAMHKQAYGYTANLDVVRENQYSAHK